MRRRQARRHEHVHRRRSSRSSSSVRRRLPRLHEVDPVPRRTTRSRPRSRARTTCARARRCGSPASTSARSPRSSARSKGDNGAVVTMRIQDKGRPLHKDARFKIRPRIFLEGNFFVDVTPGTPAHGGRRRPHVPGQPDRHAGPARPGPDRAADRHARGPQDAAARVRRRPEGKRRQGLQPLDQVLEAGLPRLGDRLRGDARREGARPLGLHRPRRGRRPARSTATAGS